MQFATYNLRHAICDIQFATCNLLHEICNVQIATCNLQHAIFNMQYATCNMQCLIWNVQFWKCNLVSAICKAQYAMYNLQFEFLDIPKFSVWNKPTYSLSKLNILAPTLFPLSQRICQKQTASTYLKIGVINLISIFQSTKTLLMKLTINCFNLFTLFLLYWIVVDCFVLCYVTVRHTILNLLCCYSFLLLWLLLLLIMLLLLYCCCCCCCYCYYCHCYCCWVVIHIHSIYPMNANLTFLLSLSSVFQPRKWNNSPPPSHPNLIKVMVEAGTTCWSG